MNTIKNYERHFEEKHQAENDRLIFLGMTVMPVTVIAYAIVRLILR